LYAANHWTEVFPGPVLDLAKIHGQFQVVPLNIHRMNVLWYRRDALRAIGREDRPPATWDEFFQVADQLVAAGWKVFVFNPAYPGGSRASWTAGTVFETILLAYLGGDGWEGLFQA